MGILGTTPHLVPQGGGDGQKSLPLGIPQELLRLSVLLQLTELGGHLPKVLGQEEQNIPLNGYQAVLKPNVSISNEISSIINCKLNLIIVIIYCIEFFIL